MNRYKRNSETRKKYMEEMHAAAKAAGVPFGKKTCIRIWRSLGHTRCAYCCQKMVFEPDHPNSCTFDHIVPVCRGGNNDFQNSILACESCNIKKGDQDLSNFARENDLPRKDWLMKKNREAKRHLRIMGHFVNITKKRDLREEEIAIVYPCPHTRKNLENLMRKGKSQVKFELREAA